MKFNIKLLTLIISIFLFNCLNVNAMEQNIQNDSINFEEVSLGTSSVELYENPDDVLSASYRSTSKPTQYWNLSSRAYSGNLVEVRVNWLYTNYYFSPNSSGIIFLDYNISPLNVSGTKMQIGLYNKSTDSFVKYYTSSGAPTSSCLRVTGLNKNQHYAFAFKAIRDPNTYNGVSGTIKVYQ